MNNVFLLENVKFIKINYFIFGKDIYLNNIIKNNILLNILKIKNKTQIINITIDSILNWYDILYKHLSNDLFNIKKIIIININKNFLFKINNIENIMNYINNNIIIIIYNNFLCLNNKKRISNIFFKKNIYIIDCQINIKNRFFNFIKLKINDFKNIRNNLLILNWFYSIYNNNFFIIEQILFIFNNKKIKNIFNKLISNPLIININNLSWIYSILIGNFTLSIINLFIIKNKSFYEIYNLLKILYKYIISIIYIKYKLYDLNKILRLNEIDINHYLIILNSINRLNFKNLFLIIKIIKKIKINIIKNNYNNIYIIDSWNKLELISFIFCKKLK